MPTSVRSRKRSATQKERWKGPDAQGCHPTYREHIVAVTKAQAAERNRLMQLGRAVDRGERPAPGEPPADPPKPADPPPAPPPPAPEPEPAKKAEGPAFGPRAWRAKRARAS